MEAMKDEPEFKTYIERNGQVIEVFTLEDAFNNAMENRIAYHRWKMDGCVSLKDYQGVVYHENVISALNDAIGIFNGLAHDQHKQKPETI